MGRRATCFSLVTAAVLAIAPLVEAQGSPAVSPPTVRELLARNMEARGGAARWAQVRTLEIRGLHDAWSAPQPFTIERARPDRYRFDHSMFGAPVTLAWDGARPWMQSPIFGAPDGAPLEENWKRNVAEEAWFVSRLQALAASGTPIELEGRAEVDGTAAWRLRATPPDAPPETWYLDAATGLELERESTTFDVFSGAIEMEMETFYMDFREVEGLRLPFREERHFGTRYHVLMVEAVRVNPPIEEARFELGTGTLSGNQGQDNPPR